MRRLILTAALLAGACAAPGGPVTYTQLAAADASTSLIVGEQLRAEYQTTRPSSEGMDPVVTMTLRHPDGRAMVFQQANHAPHHLMAQSAGGALAQIMGLFGDETPSLYIATPDRNRGAPFVCATDGPLTIGVHESADGSVRIVGLKQEIVFETRPDGVEEALPYSPDQVCARLNFRRS